MTTEGSHIPAPETPEWVRGLDDALRSSYDQVRQRNIDALLPGVRTLLESCVPGLGSERPDEFEAAALLWATGLRNHFEDGIQVFMEAYDRNHGATASDAMRRAAGN